MFLKIVLILFTKLLITMLKLRRKLGKIFESKSSIFFALLRKTSKNFVLSLFFFVNFFDRFLESVARNCQDIHDSHQDVY